MTRTRTRTHRPDYALADRRNELRLATDALRFADGNLAPASILELTRAAHALVEADDMGRPTRPLTSVDGRLLYQAVQALTRHEIGRAHV